MIPIFSTLQNIDLLSVGIVVAGMMVMGFAVLFNDSKSASNRVFFYLTITASLWGIINFLSYQPYRPDISFWLLRIVMFFGLWASFFTYKFTYTFPYKDFNPSFFYKWVVTPLTMVMSLLTLTPFVFNKVSGVINEHVTEVINGPGIVLFALNVIFLNLGAVIILARKIKKANKVERKLLKTVLLGVCIMLFLIITFNFLFPAFWGNTKMIPLGAFFMFPFIAFTSYAILKQKLFNIKVAATAILVFLLSIVLFLEIIFSNSISLIIFRSSIFLLVLVFGINLIKSVLREVEQKEKLAKLNMDLHFLIKQRESLVHLITHKVKGSFTRTKLLFAGMLEGTFGEISPEIKKRAAQGLEFDNGGIETVDLVLNVANMQNGIIKYEMKPLDLKDLALQAVNDKKMGIEVKGLKLELDIKDGIYNINGDAIWIKEALNNLIENSIKYTKEGKIIVGLERHDDKILFSVKDTGVGITEEDKKNLFTEGGRGKESIKVNVDSTGYGLYTVKLVIEAHGGRVWAESLGQDKGSQFYIELPIAQ